VRLGISAAQITKSLGHIGYTETDQFLLNVMRREVLTWGSAISAKSHKSD
jgi:hypothetical protein